ncbi:MAG: dTMP kinase [Campylobacterales bacterium]
MYVSIEGIDTSGKSTQIELLKKEFKDALFVSEPGFTELGSKIRDIVLHSEIKSSLARMMLFLADRAELYEEVLSQNRDRLIISDRSAVSGIAYAKGFDDKLLLELNSLVLKGTFPSKCVVLELSEQELKNRLSKKEHDSIEKEGVEYLLDVQSRIKNAAKLIKSELLICDASESRDEIFLKIKEFIV